MTPYADWVTAPSGIVLSQAAATARYVPPRRPIGIDLFCGAGGFSLGFKQAGYEVVAALDHDVHAMITYSVNLCRYDEFAWHFVDESDSARLEKELQKAAKQADLKAKKKGPLRGFPTAGRGWIADQPGVPGTSHLWLGDIHKVTGAEILAAIGMERGDVDVVFGGPPCQGFSMAGRRNVVDPRNSLVFDFARLVCEIKPKAMVLENVAGITTMTTPEGIPVITALSRVLEDGGFEGIDALKRVMAEQKNAGVAMRAKPVSEESEEQGVADEQLGFFT